MLRSSPVVGTGGALGRWRLGTHGGRSPEPAASTELLAEKQAAEEALRDLQARVDNAQQLANMGDYDWEIASDTNRWSDQLFRIYGHEPQSFSRATSGSSR